MAQRTSKAWLAFIIAAGAVVLVAPRMAAAAGSPGSSDGARRSIRMCSPFRGDTMTYRVDGRRLTLSGGSCGAIAVRVELNTIQLIPRRDEHVYGVTVGPESDFVSFSSKTDTVRVRVKRGSVDVQFTVGPPKPGAGWIEVCAWAYKDAPPPPGEVTFTITSGKVPSTVAVTTGGCSAPVSVKTSKATVSETVPAGYELRAVDTLPSWDLENVDYWTATATVWTGAGVNVETDFFNAPT